LTNALTAVPCAWSQVYNYHLVSTIGLFDKHSYSGAYTEFEILGASLLNIKSLCGVTPLAMWRLPHLGVSYTCPSNIYEVCVFLHGLKEKVLPPREHKTKRSHENIFGCEWIWSSFETSRSTLNTLTM
jgi:hypothetical protein